MITCPVCENAQVSGDECQVCGRYVPGPSGPGEASASPLPDLEPTLYQAGAPAPAEAFETLPGLEATRYEAGAPAPAEPEAPWLERSRADAVGPVAVAPLPDLEPHRAQPVPGDDEPTGQGPGVCRYCRAAAAPGDRFCSRCGMRLPRFDPVAMALSELGQVVCPGCGAVGEGPLCRRCGSAMVRS